LKLTPHGLHKSPDALDLDCFSPHHSSTCGEMAPAPRRRLLLKRFSGDVVVRRSTGSDVDPQQPASWVPPPWRSVIGVSRDRM